MHGLARVLRCAAPPLRRRVLFTPCHRAVRWYAAEEEVSEAALGAQLSPQEQGELDEKYQKLSHREHVLQRPDTYLGSVTRAQVSTWGWDPEEELLHMPEANISPALLKIFDEIITNAADQYHRMRDSENPVKKICVSIAEDGGTISVMNDGKCLETDRLSSGQRVPDLVFGEMLSGSNFVDDGSRTWGGRNGYGAKLTNVYSKDFKVIIGDSSKQIKYEQTWTNNMSEKPNPEGVDTSYLKSTDFTEIQFTPDYKRFGLEMLDKDHRHVFYRRAADILASVVSLNANVYDGPDLTLVIEGNDVPIDSFETYVKMHYSFVREMEPQDQEDEADEEDADEGDCDEDAEDGGHGSWKDTDLVFTEVKVKIKTTVKVADTETVESSAHKWEIGLAWADPEWDLRNDLDVSFVNSVRSCAGTHVEKVRKAMTTAIYDQVKPKSQLITQSFVQQHIAVFVNCIVPEPAWKSQCKEDLTKPTKGDMSMELSKAFKAALKKSDIPKKIIAAWEKKRTLQDAERKKQRVKPDKLEDARMAGKSLDCHLLVTEGDSAKALAVAGLSEVGRDYWGVFPLRGKTMNVMKATETKIDKNPMLEALRCAIGLDHDMTYEYKEELETLRYGRVVLMCDQDHDGAHIKGLVLSYLNYKWPKLMEAGVHGRPFVCHFLTPLVKAKSDKTEKWLFNKQDLVEFEEKEGALNQYKLKYYKGLGTSSNKEGKEYFKHAFNEVLHAANNTGKFEKITKLRNGKQLKEKKVKEGVKDPDQRMLVDFKLLDSGDRRMIDLAFGPKPENRKPWLTDGDSRYAPQQGSETSLATFFNTDVREYFKHSNERTIPSVMDGLKPSTRKILFTCFERGLSGSKEMKVAHLGAAVAESTAYHHGEHSLQSAIVKLAQNFVGSGNNINLLEPLGQFGTRLEGGQDHASARYIYTRLSPMARRIFPAEDDALLTRQKEEKEVVEPVFYAPILPMVLVNGSSGVGTGMATKVPSYDPAVLAAYLVRLLTDDAFKNSEMEKMDNVKVAAEKYRKADRKYSEKKVEVHERMLMELTPTQGHKDAAKSATIAVNKHKESESTLNCEDKEQLDKFKSEADVSKKRLDRTRSENPVHKKLAQPWYEGFKGTWVGNTSHVYVPEDEDHSTHWQRDTPRKGEDTITELPVQMWVEDFKKKLSKKAIVKEVVVNGDDADVEIVVKYRDDADTVEIEKLRKKEGKMKIGEHNFLPLWSANGNEVWEFNDVREVILCPEHGFYHKRLDVYLERKKKNIENVEKEIEFLKNKIKFFTFCVDNKDLLFVGEEGTVVEKIMEDKNLEEAFVKRMLSSVRLNSLNEGRRQKLDEELELKTNELTDLKVQEPSQMWVEELHEFFDDYRKNHQRDDLRRFGSVFEATRWF
eukprot:TRINITY_DN10064_c0_g1_i4.p1 TRINITY_DN10064_c0_g1~~TRINITY_DN10064_c0_g1_i4.p1  ORF type:complete len:1382 (+),score=379.12 TRINITY_DN10064_c0_g1_i4:66-4211(+)